MKNKYWILIAFIAFAMAPWAFNYSNYPILVVILYVIFITYIIKKIGKKLF